MPAEGLDWLPTPEVLTDDEVMRLIRIAVEQLGVTEVRFTGGEPLVRRGFVDIVRRTTALSPRPRTAVTTNGLGLTRYGGTASWRSPGGTASTTWSRAWQQPPKQACCQ
jgi:cyclic pyranopterin phosphate synthase